MNSFQGTPSTTLSSIELSNHTSTNNGGPTENTPITDSRPPSIQNTTKITQTDSNDDHGKSLFELS